MDGLRAILFFFTSIDQFYIYNQLIYMCNHINNQQSSLKSPPSKFKCVIINDNNNNNHIFVYY